MTKKKKAVTPAEKRLMDKIDIKINKYGFAYIYGKKVYRQRIGEVDYMYFWAERGTDNIKRTFARRYTNVEGLKEETWDGDDERE